MEWLSEEEKYRGMLNYLSKTMDTVEQPKADDKLTTKPTKTM